MNKILKGEHILNYQTFFKMERTNFKSCEQNMTTETFSIRMDKIWKMRTFFEKEKEI